MSTNFLKLHLLVFMKWIEESFSLGPTVVQPLKYGQMRQRCYIDKDGDLNIGMMQIS